MGKASLRNNIACILFESLQFVFLEFYYGITLTLVLEVDKFPGV